MDQIASPPTKLMELTTGKSNFEVFLSSGKASKLDIEQVLALHGRTLADFSRVLDFGVGVGRVSRHLDEIAELVGVDVMPEMIAWLKEEMPFGTWIQNNEYPPLPFDAGSFDLVINHSVFTHLNIEHQDLWLAELSRVLKPGGLAILSFSGDVPFAGYLKSLRDNGAPERAIIHEADFLREGYKWIEEDSWRDTDFPDWYHSMFHSPQYVFKHWAQWFEIISWKKCGNLNFQDNIVARKI